MHCLTQGWHHKQMYSGQGHKALPPEGPIPGLKLHGCHLDIFNKVGTWSPHFPFILGPAIACPVLPGPVLSSEKTELEGGTSTLGEATVCRMPKGKLRDSLVHSRQLTIQARKLSTELPAEEGREAARAAGSP